MLHSKSVQIQVNGLEILYEIEFSTGVAAVDASQDEAGGRFGWRGGGGHVDAGAIGDSAGSDG